MKSVYPTINMKSIVLGLLAGTGLVMLLHHTSQSAIMEEFIKERIAGKNDHENFDEEEKNLEPFDLKNIASYAEDDPRLIVYIRKEYLKLPPKIPLYRGEDGEVFRVGQEDISQMKQHYWVTKIFKGKKNGIFVEAGAYNGIEISNTLALEQNFNWTGLLIEADHTAFEALRLFGRNATIINACLNKISRAEEVIFHEAGTLGGIDISDFLVQVGSKITKRQVMCFPFYSVARAAKMTEIDYFSLDVEGAEYAVLNTIPWDKMKIKVFSIEWKHTPEGSDTVWNLMAKQGYECLKNLENHDFLLYHPGHMSEAGLQNVEEVKKEIGFVRRSPINGVCLP